MTVTHLVHICVGHREVTMATVIGK